VEVKLWLDLSFLETLLLSDRCGLREWRSEHAFEQDDLR
jgi:hypothetical protein